MFPRYKKITRDLTSEFSKNLLLVIAIAIGLFGIGSVLGCYSVISREMTSNYQGTNPASATLEISRPISKGIVDSVKNFPGIREAERHATIAVRMKVGGKWMPLLLFVIDDFAEKRTNTIERVSGSKTPAEGTMLVERTALIVMQAKEGEEMLVKTFSGQQRKLKISGVIHDAGLAPAWQEQAGYGYITLSTLRWMGETRGFDQMRIVVSDSVNSTKHITNKSSELSTWLGKNNYSVKEIQVPPPGRHPHEGQMKTVLMIFIVFSFLILILGSLLVATGMSTVMVKQVRQIGVMKTIGASSGQIMGLYFAMVVGLSLAALLISIPLSRIAAELLYSQIAVLLNLEIKDHTIPIAVPAIQLMSGIFIPLAAAAFTVIRGSRMSVREAINNYGLAGNGTTGISWTFLARQSFLSETFKLSIRNVFRLRSRLIMTISLLAIGGATFMMAMNVSSAWDQSLKRIYVQRLYDVEMRLTETILPDSILTEIKKIEGVRAAEAWNYSSTSLAKKGGYEVSHTYPDKGHGSFTMLALPVPTALLNPTITQGVWLRSDSASDVVLNQLAFSFLPNVKIGDWISLSANDAPSKWHVVGFCEDMGSPATAYVSLTGFARKTGTSGYAKLIRVSYTDRSNAHASRKNREVESLFERAKIPVGASVPVWLLRNAVAGHMRVLINSLLAMAVLMALVGTLGLMSTMSMSVMERTREIGVMRAIGATPGQIRSLLAWEGIAIGILSLVLAFVLALVLSVFMGNFIGRISFRISLPLSISGGALTLWTAIILIGSWAATVFPARRANRISTREALS